MPVQAQVIWSENFTYPNGTITGGNNNTANPAADWTRTCATCVSGDWFEVRSNLMEGLDTNGPATLETEVIDISSVAAVEFSVDLSESGTLEGCPSGSSCGCNCIDWIRIQYQLNGGAYVDCTSSLGGACSGSCAGDTYVTIDDFTSTSFTQCPLFGSTLRLRISVQCWAADEFMRIDNLVVRGATCPFPVVFSAFEVADRDGTAWLSWQTAEESGSDHFVVERSLDGQYYTAIGSVEAAGHSSSPREYAFQDVDVHGEKMYYRIRQVDQAGDATYSMVREWVRGTVVVGALRLFPNPACDRLLLETEMGDLRGIEVKDVSGRTVQTVTVTSASRRHSMSLEGLAPGLYFVEALTSGGLQAGKFVRL